MHNKPHKLMTRKQQSLTQIPGIIFFYLSLCYIYIYIYMCMCVCVCLCVHMCVCVCCDLAASISYCLFQVIWQYTEIAYCLTPETNGFRRNEPKTVLQVAAALGFCRSWVETETKQTHKIHCLLSGQDSTLFT